VHEHRSTDETINSVTSSQPEVTASEDGMRRYGRHGDIKPENILWFDKVDKKFDDCQQGFLVIADFGLTDLHRRGTRSDIPALLISGTPTYEPPELQLNGTISRAYDIWSLGCTFLEFITWLVCGWDVLDQFPEARKMPTLRNLREDTFFHIPLGEPKTAIICKGVVLWIAEMRQLSRCSSFVEDFLDLISEKMLVVEPQARINARGLNTKLKEMIRKATEDPSYLTQRRGKRRRQQEDQCDDYIQHEFSMYSLPNGTMPVPNKYDGEPLPKRRRAAITSQRFRSLSPPIENNFYADIPK
jgi:serine/threonine protein kinase